MAHYRKQKLFVYAREQQHYTAGDAPVVVEVKGVRIAPFICFDLRYPELFRAVAPEVDAMLLLANWPAARRVHWDVLVRARAIEWLCHGFLPMNRATSACSKSARTIVPSIRPLTQNSPVFSCASALEPSAAVLFTHLSRIGEEIAGSAIKRTLDKLIERGSVTHTGERVIFGADADVQRAIGTRPGFIGRVARCGCRHRLSLRQQPTRREPPAGRQEEPVSFM